MMARIYKGCAHLCDGAKYFKNKYVFSCDKCIANSNRSNRFSRYPYITVNIRSFANKQYQTTLKILKQICAEKVGAGGA